jgi:hypothetical protein
MATPQKIEKLK